MARTAECFDKETDALLFVYSIRRRRNSACLASSYKTELAFEANETTFIVWAMRIAREAKISR